MLSAERTVDRALLLTEHEARSVRARVVAGLFYEIGLHLLADLGEAALAQGRDVRLTFTATPQGDMGDRLRLEAIPQPDVEKLKQQIAALQDQLVVKELVIHRLRRELEGTLRE